MVRTEIVIYVILFVANANFGRKCWLNNAKLLSFRCRGAAFSLAAVAARWRDVLGG